ncbi:PREDICTED: exonuclease 3'-5' domain-containing protein 1 [Gekko japonicus]|uniref:Exonuclease 3'-5' domain-containing protein 1 n=1 Tax=Gekko japonicus TaxID=146911 RepID=A0ABM1LGA2_GEKJA|nr:PREDICTED: exonuclease 3'-5' domain-containing protein 1 [Gekko japonicus]
MDPSSDYYFLSDALGRTVEITLKCGIFQGVLQHVDSNRSILINRVKNLENGRCIPGVKMFFGHEIVNVQLLDESNKCGAEGMETPTSANNYVLYSRENPVTRMAAKNREESLKQNNQVSNAASQKTKHLNLCHFKSTCSDDDTEEAIEYIVIDQFQRKFGSAMMHIKKQNVCAIAAEGVNLCRHGKLSWLQVATRSHVFLFDIFLLGARVFKNGLQMILEDRNILKVIHDCRWLSDCLSHQYGIMLSNVFDTQVADVLYFSMETGGFLPNCICTLQECLMQHLGLPYKQVSFMVRRQHAVERNPEVWFVRPLPPALLNVLALETFYLLPLRMMLLDEIMSDLTALVDGYLNAFREGSADPLGSTEFSCMELPQELRQLANFHKLQREKAVQKFQQNEEGLLIRKPAETLERKTARKEANERESTGLISSNRAAYLTTFSVSPVHFLGPVNQDNSVKEEWKTNNWDSHSTTAGGSNVNSEIETMDSVSWEQFQRQCCTSVSEETKAREKEQSPKFNLQRKAAVILKEEIKQSIDKDEVITNTAISAPLFQKMNSSPVSFQGGKLPSPSVEPFYQALSNTAELESALSKAT